MQSHLLYIIYIVYIRTNVLIYPIHIIYNFLFERESGFLCWNWVLELVVKRLRLVAVDVINNLAHGIVNSFRSVGDVVVCHVRPGVPEAKGNSFSGYLKFRADRGEGVTSGVHRHAFRYRMPDNLAQPAHLVRNNLLAPDFL